MSEKEACTKIATRFGISEIEVIFFTENQRTPRGKYKDKNADLDDFTKFHKKNQKAVVFSKQSWLSPIGLHL